MNILHLSAASSLSGAGKAAWITHSALIDIGVKSKLLYLVPDPKESLSTDVSNYQDSNGLLRHISRVIFTKIDQLPLFVYPYRYLEIFSTGIVGHSIHKTLVYEWADIIHIHWSNHGFINIADIPTWKKPIVWTIRDMWPFTGGCHHSFECLKFTSVCDSCPQLKSSNIPDLSTYIQGRKIKYLSEANIKWVAISEWLKNIAELSSVLEGCHIEVIPSGVSSVHFNNIDKRESRRLLNMNHDDKLILVGATNIREKYKGFDFVRQSLNMLSGDIKVATFGNQTFQFGEIPQEFFHYGHVDERELRFLYNAADIFLAPSIAEAMGKAHLEAQLCGTPVVCFDETGPADIVEHKLTGYLADYMNANSLYEGIVYCLNNEIDRHEIVRRARKYDISEVALKYRNLYEKSLLDRTSHT